MKLKPVLKDAIWAGQRLAAEYGKSDNPNKKIAESWELAVHKNGVNVIENGEYAGKTLEEFFLQDKSIVAPDYTSDKFPLMIKFIDAEQDLSVQVHPDDDYAAKYENGELGKTEMWYIIDAKPGAKIVYGLNDNYTREDLQNLIDNGRFEECLNYIEVSPGDVYFIPAGLVHAIGAGILVAEVQQNSDTTYRFYDYNRLDANGNLRELHTKKALDVCIKTKAEYEKKEFNAKIWNNLVECEYFSVAKITPLSKIIITEENTQFNSIICIKGDGEIIHDGKVYKIKKGDSYFLSAKLGECEIKKISEDFKFILTTLNNLK